MSCMSTPAHARTMIAITGHRHLKAEDAVESSMRAVLAGIASGSARPGSPEFQLTMLSSLAEGADRVAAREVLCRPGGTLRAVLPLPIADYEQDFANAGSRAEFRALLACAEAVEVVAVVGDRNASYRTAGRRVVDLCDVLIAVWNEKPGRGVGGTADVVGYARELGKPLIIISSEAPELIVRERCSSER